jgi:hypothetical protein
MQKTYPAVTLNTRKQGEHGNSSQQGKALCSRLHREMLLTDEMDIETRISSD